MDTNTILNSINDEISKLSKVRDLLAGYTFDSPAVEGPSYVRRTIRRKPLSDAARARISAAQKKRWAVHKKAA